MTTTVLVVTSSDECVDRAWARDRRFDAAVVAFWSSPEFVQELVTGGIPVCLRLSDLVADHAADVRRRFAIAQQIVAGLPTYRGIKPLQAYETTIATALMNGLVAFRLHAELAARFGPGTSVVFLTGNDLATAFADVNRHAAIRLEVSRAAPVRTRERKVTRRVDAARRLAASWRGWHDLDRLGWAVAEWVDERYAARQRLWPAARVRSGRCWAYGSYVNFTRVLAGYEDDFDEPPAWLVNGRSARLGVPCGAEWSYLWQFRPSSRDEAVKARVLRETREHVERLDGVTDDLPIGEIARGNHQIIELATRVLRHALEESDLMAAFLETARPSSLWLANQWGSEGLLVQLAAARGLPVTQVQHGTLEQYYDCAPIYSDRFLVWGPLWAESVRNARPEQIDIVLPRLPSLGTIVRTAPGQARRVMFFTAPARHLPFWNAGATAHEVTALLSSLVRAGCRVTIRLHPMDEPDLWRQAWQRRFGPLPETVVLDSGTPLERLLEETDVALIFFSTVFVDCAAAGIPVVSMGWYPLIWQPVLERDGWFIVGRSIDEVRRLIASPGLPPARSTGSTPLARTR